MLSRRREHRSGGVPTPELYVERYLAERPDLVRHLGQDRRGRFGTDDLAAGRWLVDRVLELTAGDVDQRPDARLRLVALEQGRRHARFVEFGGSSVRCMAIRQLLPVAAHAVERGAEPCIALGFDEYPLALDEGRRMPRVLAVPTREIGDPLLLVVELKSRDGALHAPLQAASGWELPSGALTARCPSRAGR